MKININEDETLSVIEASKRDQGSLYYIMVSGNIQLANVLDKEDIVAVFLSVKSNPYPLGSGEKAYRDSLKIVQEGQNEGIVKLLEQPLGLLRKALVQRAGEGCNAPTDSYLRIAHDIKTGKDHVHNY